MTFEQPDVRPIGDGKWRVAKDWHYVWFDHKNVITYKVIIREGEIYDLASIPQFLTSITGITPDGPHRAATLPHDKLYRNRGKLGEDLQVYNPMAGWLPAPGRMKRSAVDKLFFDMLKYYGVPKHKRLMMEIAVKSFGWLWWYT